MAAKVCPWCPLSTSVNSGQSVLQESPEANASYLSHLHMILKDSDVVLIQSQPHRLKQFFFLFLLEKGRKYIFPFTSFIPSPTQTHYLKSSGFSFTLQRPIADISSLAGLRLLRFMSSHLLHAGLTTSLFSHQFFLVSTLMLPTNSFRRVPLVLVSSLLICASYMHLIYLRREDVS